MLPPHAVKTRLETLRQQQQATLSESQRRADGIYYTPPPLVARLVSETFGLRPPDATRPRLLDPACGSGHFLVAAYRHLLTTQAATSFATRKDILLTCIYGVDIDPQAVAMTRYALLLTLLEGIRQPPTCLAATLAALSKRIKQGNALIESDWEGWLDSPPKTKVFDWGLEFPDVMQGGGFDMLLGNPPWGSDIDGWRPYLQWKYPHTSHEHSDSFKLFIEAGVRLTRQGGLVALVVPNTLLRQRRLRDARAFLLRQQLHTVLALGAAQFEGVSSPACAFIVQKQTAPATHRVRLVEAGRERQLPQQQLQRGAEQVLIPPRQARTAQTVPLGDVPHLHCRDGGINYQRVGVGMRQKGRSDLAARLLYRGEQQHPRDQMYWMGRDLNRYWLAPTTDRYCRPNTADFIRENESITLNAALFDCAPKILLRQTADCLRATIDRRGVWFGRSVLAIVPQAIAPYRLEYFLGLLNATYLTAQYRELTHEQGRNFAQVKLSKLRQLPIRVIDFANPAEVAHHDEIARLVAQLLDLHQTATYQPSAAAQALAARVDGLVQALYEG